MVMVTTYSLVVIIQVPPFGKRPVAGRVAASAIPHSSLSFRMASVTCADSIISVEHTPDQERE